MEVIYINFNHPSFNWGNGMYIIIEERNGEYYMCKLDDNGQPELYTDGGYMISCTGKGNEGIQRTNLRYFKNIKKQIRREKLERLDR